MANPSIEEVLEVLRQSFKSIDLRAVIVAFGDGQGWQNAFTVIRFSAKTVGEISAEHDRLKKLYELPSELLNKRLGIEHNIVPYRGINVELSAYPVDRFERLVGRLREGMTKADDTLPKRFLEEKLTDSGAVLLKSELEKMLSDYYKLKGWD